MKMVDSLGQAKKIIENSVVTMGNFDGVHLGHIELIKRLTKKSKEMGSKAVVLTFEPHPMQVLYPDRDFQRLFPFSDQVEQMEKLKVDVFIRHPFTLEFSKLSPEKFLDDWLFLNLNPLALVVGYDFAFGSERHGTLNRLQDICAKRKVEVEIIPPYEKHDQIVSSSKIREFVRRGEMSQAQDFLGRPFYLNGKVIHGAHRGRTIGFPTANIDIRWNLKPRVGVYLTETLVDEKNYKSMTNVGWNPTVSETRNGLKIETHILDFDGSLYDKEIVIKFFKFLREEKKFSSLDELQTQLNKDRKYAKEYFNENPQIC